MRESIHYFIQDDAVEILQDIIFPEEYEAALNFALENGSIKCVTWLIDRFSPTYSSYICAASSGNSLMLDIVKPDWREPHTKEAYFILELYRHSYDLFYKKIFVVLSKEYKFIKELCKQAIIQKRHKLFQFFMEVLDPNDPELNKYLSLNASP